MSHGITSKDSMASVHERPWHGLGAVLKRHPRSVDDALKKMGLDWPIIQLPVYRKRGSRYELVEGFKQNVRKDTDEVLAIVSDDYAVFQQREAFAFLADLLGSELFFETGGSLFGGRKVFVTVKLANVPWIEVGGDRTDLYCNLFNHHDKSGSMQLLTTPVRTVCNNTWEAAIGSAVNRFFIRHIGDASIRLAEAREALDLSIDYSKQFKKFGDRLAKQKIAERKVKAIAAELWPGEGTDRQVASAQRRREAVVHLFLEGDTVGNAPGSKWCAANAFIESVEWGIGGRKPQTPQAQFTRHFEDPTGLKAKALDLVVNA